MYSFLIKWRNVNIVVYGNLIVKCNLNSQTRRHMIISITALCLPCFAPVKNFLVLSCSSLKNFKERPIENLMTMYIDLTFMVDFLSANRVEESLYLLALIA